MINIDSQKISFIPKCWAIPSLLSLITFLFISWESPTWKLLPQRSQLKGLKPVCFRLWVIRFDDWLNALPQTMHLCGFSPEKVVTKMTCGRVPQGNTNLGICLQARAAGSLVRFINPRNLVRLTLQQQSLVCLWRTRTTGIHFGSSMSQSFSFGSAACWTNSILIYKRFWTTFRNLERPFLYLGKIPPFLLLAFDFPLAVRSTGFHQHSTRPKPNRTNLDCPKAKYFHKTPSK